MIFLSLWVFLLTPLPFIAYKFLPKENKQTTALRVPFYHRAKHASSQDIGGVKIQTSRLRLLLLCLIWSLLLIAAARPTHFGEAVPVDTVGRDLMLAMDISGSMGTPDMIIRSEAISRLVVVKYILGEFLEKRQGDRVGLILFGTEAYLQAPLTFDLTTVGVYLEESSLRLAGEKTAIGDAIGLAVKRLKDRPESHRVLILLTDGQNTAGNILPKQAAEMAAQAQS